MSKSTIDWHHRFSQQAAWTKPLRDYLFSQVELACAGRVLEVGCGTGVLLQEIESLFGGDIFGLDIDPNHLAQASCHTIRSHLVHSDAHALPFPNDSFDITFCHFLLLWIKKPVQVLFEMSRITRPGGHVLALAEPDYGGRIDYPFELERAGAWQQESLRLQGADPHIGRQLAEVFTQAGLVDVQTGLLGGQWDSVYSGEAWASEWEVLEHDLKYLPQGWNRAQVDELKRIEEKARERGARILYVPTFYAWGKK